MNPHPRPGLLPAVLAGALLLSILVGTLGLMGGTASLRSPPGAEVPMVTWGDVVEVDQGEAVQGPWRMNQSEFRYVDAPSVDLSDDGRMAVVWVDQSRKDILFQFHRRDGEPSPSPPANVSRSSDVFSWLPRVALDPHDPERVHVLWQEIIFSGGSHGGEILYARSTDGGRSFTDPVNLSQTPAGAGKGRLNAEEWHNGSLDLALGPEGEVHVAWTEYEGPLRFRSSQDGGRSFDDPVTVFGEDGDLPARGPSLGVGADGVIHLAWTVGEDPGADIHLSRSGNGGRSFSPPHHPAPTEGHADAPKLAVDPDGAVHLAFGDRPRGPRGPSKILYARSTDGGERFEDPRELTDPEEVGAAFPHLAVASAGRIHLLWERFPQPDRHPQGLAHTTSADGGDSFSTPSPVPGTSGPDLGFSGSLQGLLMRKLAASPRGELAVVNSTFNPGERSRVRLIPGRVAAP
jgi:hypothetical protein